MQVWVFITCILAFKNLTEVEVASVWSLMKVTMSYLKFLPSNSLHVTLFANDEFVGHNMVFWVVLDPCEIISILDDLCHELEVMALWDDIIRDTWGVRDRISIEWFLKDHVTLK